MLRFVAREEFKGYLQRQLSDWLDDYSERVAKGEVKFDYALGQPLSKGSLLCSTTNSEPKHFSNTNTIGRWVGWPQHISMRLQWVFFSCEIDSPPLRPKTPEEDIE